MKIKLIIFLFLSVAFGASAAKRIELNLNDNWTFAKDPKNLGVKAQLAWQKINIPHTWNAKDVMDDEAGYYRGIGWYKKKLALKPEWRGKKIYVYFEAANQETSVYLNGKLMGNHIGGYTGFRIALQNLKFDGADELAVKVNNSYNENIAPLTADFTFFGGIYRSVSLLVLNAVHFEDKQFGSKGIFVNGDKVTDEKANVMVKGNFVNQSKLTRSIKINSVVLNSKGAKIVQTQWQTTAKANQNIAFKLPHIEVKQPKLWSPENPYLYQVKTSIVDAKTNQVLDEVTTNLGMRYFHFDAEKGFFLNGKYCKLIGTSRHQDFEGLGNAVPKALQVKDIDLLKEMGGNFLRVAHYPQDQAVLDACDRLGILTSVEIPIVNEITESTAFTASCRQMQVEMIKQNFNHPSVIIWAYMNEVLLRMRYGKEPERKAVYLKSIEALAQNLEDLTRQTDSTRYTMMSNHGDVKGYMAAGLVKIPMLVGWNLYQGWYGGKSEDFGPALDNIHKQIPDKPILVTEFGADIDPRIHAFNPVRFDKGLEYGMLYHQIYINAIMKRSFVVGAAVWNLADFNSETRSESMPHINNKGLLTQARKPKNTYYLYKAHFNAKSYVKIGDGSWQYRSAISATNQANQQLQVISNTDSVELIANGTSLGKQNVVDKLTNWNVSFINGKNTLKAVAASAKIEDISVINFKIIPTQPINFNSINILLGSQREFIDDKNQVWLPSPIYQKGSFGFTGGEAFKMKNTSRLSYGSDKDILGTPNDPIYQTQQEGIESYQLDVPKGKYELTLHFAELAGNNQSVLPYNLDSLAATGKEIPEQRVFDVLLNGNKIIDNLNVAAKFGAANKVEKKFECIVANENGIKLEFKPIKGKTILNALQVRKIN